MLKRKIEAPPENFRKAQNRFNRLFRFLRSKKGRIFLAMQGSKNLQELIEICRRSLSLAESHEFWEFVERTAKEARETLPEWVKGGRSERFQEQR